MSDLKLIVETLARSAQDFNVAMQQLISLRGAARLEPALIPKVQKLIADGASIRSAIRSTTSIIDGAQRWIGKTFQTNAIDTIPFAPDIIKATTLSATSAIAHYMDTARPIVARLVMLQKRIDAMPDEEKAGLAANAVPVTPAPEPSIKPALILIAVIAGVIWWQRENVEGGL